MDGNGVGCFSLGSRVHPPSFLRTRAAFPRTHTVIPADVLPVIPAYTHRRSRVHAPSFSRTPPSFPRTRESRDIKTTVNPVPPDHPGSLSWKRRALFFSGFPRTRTVIPGISTVVLAYTRRHSRGSPSFLRTHTVVLAYTGHSRGRGNDIKTTVNPVPPDHPGSLSWKRRALFFSGFPRPRE